MSMKSWVLDRVHGVAGRPDLRAHDSTHGREPDLDADDRRTRPDSGFFAEPTLADVEHLGAYAPLIGAIRDELEHFVASHVRLHVAIADRDRFTLTALGVRSPGGAAARELLQQFMREFRPEQVKRYLAREVIGRLPNAGTIDLAQFAGLADLEARGRGVEEDSEYGELMAALRIEPPATLHRPYEISVLGRWTEHEPIVETTSARRRAETPATPLAGRAFEFDVEDGAGRRRTTLHAVVPGRRYVIGKSDDCDIRVDGTYTSRRHAELWFERGGWYVADAGSTNGIRVERAASGDAKRGGRVEPEHDDASADAPERDAHGTAPAVALEDGSRLVLSARAEGPPGDYPWLALRAAPAREAATPIAAPVTTSAGLRETSSDAMSNAPSNAMAVASKAPSVPMPRAAPPAVPSTVPMVSRRAAPSTPRTAVFSTRAVEPVFEIAEACVDGARVHIVRASELPISIGRSRRQTLVIDWSHRGVSGHHVEIEAIDDDAAHGVVHGDNGIDVDGAHRGPGDRFAWRLGQTMVLGGALPGEASCTLTLTRRADGADDVISGDADADADDDLSGHGRVGND